MPATSSAATTSYRRWSGQHPRDELHLLGGPLRRPFVQPQMLRGDRGREVEVLDDLGVDVERGLHMEELVRRHAPDLGAVVGGVGQVGQHVLRPVGVLPRSRNPLYWPE